MKRLAKEKVEGTEPNPIPEDWELLELCKIAELIKDAYIPSENEALHYIGLEHINQQTLSLNSRGKSSDVTSNKFRFQTGDILFGKLRPYFRKVYRPRFDGICSTDIWVIRAKEGVDQGWLFYLFASEDFVRSASGGSSGTRMPRADWHHMKNTVWPIPKNISEQKKIAKILCSLDEKIELNRRMNANLEKMAGSLFKKVFVDVDAELPEGWRVGKVSDLIKVESGFPFSSNVFDDAGHYKLVTIKNVQDGYFIYECTDSLNAIPEKMPEHCRLKDGDILLSLTGNVGRVCIMTGENYLLNQRVAVLNPINEKNRAFVYLLFRQKDFQNRLEGISRGTAQQNLSPIETKSLKINIPPEDVLNDFARVSGPMFEIIIENLKQIQRLSNLRDSLLSRLMSGKIRV